jgi:hypothetical protein
MNFVRHFDLVCENYEAGLFSPWSENLQVLTVVASSARCDLKEQSGNHLQLAENKLFGLWACPQVLRIRKSCELRFVTTEARTFEAVL